MSLKSERNLVKLQASNCFEKCPSPFPSQNWGHAICMYVHSTVKYGPHMWRTYWTSLPQPNVSIIRPKGQERALSVHNKQVFILLLISSKTEGMLFVWACTVQYEICDFCMMCLPFHETPEVGVTVKNKSARSIQPNCPILKHKGQVWGTISAQ
jgi:hypothetical protein